MCRRFQFVFLFLLLFIIIGSNADSPGNLMSSDKKQLVNMSKFMNMFNLANVLKYYRAFIKDLRASVKADEGHTCVRDMNLLLIGLMNMDEWALKMLDSASKIPSGLLQGNIVDLGMFDECKATVGEFQDYQIHGQHCMYIVNIPMISGLPAGAGLTLSSCLPSSCDSHDVVIILNLLIKYGEKIIGEQIGYTNSTGIKVLAADCSKTDVKIWDTEFILAMAIFGVFFAFLIICTVCDLIKKQMVDFKKHRTLMFISQFSLIENGKKILSMKTSPGTLPSLHGIRFLSIAWVVLGHTYNLQLTAPNMNTMDILNWVGSSDALYIFLAPNAVDTFFTLGGFLLAYIFLKQMPKQKRFNVPVFYLHRYFRLTPSVIVLLTMAIIFLPKIYSGPRWDTMMDLFTTSCRSRWWSVILYVQNYLPSDDRTCLQWLWYLNVDMQLFFISPIILYPLYVKPIIGIVLAVILSLASMAAAATITAINGYHVLSFSQIAQLGSMNDIFQDVYSQPYCRAAPYFIGILLGYELATYKRKLNKLVVWIGWLLTVVFFAICAVGTRYFTSKEYEYNAFLETSFTIISRPLWSLGVCWIIYASVYKHAGWISNFLNCKFFIPLSRISYWIYLIHILVMLVRICSTRTPLYFSDYFVFNSFVSDLTISIVIAFFCSLIFESPLLILEKMLLRRMKESQSESQKDLRPGSEEDIVNKSERTIA